MRKLDKQVAQRIASKLREIAQLDDPRSQGKALAGSMASLWRHRVGDYRIVCDIEDAALVVHVVDMDHESGIYRKGR